MLQQFSAQLKKAGGSIKFFLKTLTTSINQKIKLAYLDSVFNIEFTIQNQKII